MILSSKIVPYLRGTRVRNLKRTVLATLLTMAALTSHAQETEPGLALVNTEPLKNVVFFPEYSAPARVESLNNSQISARISALILEIPPRVGDVVKKGERLVRLDCTDAKFNQASSSARLLLARKEVNRLSKLKKASAITEQSLNAAETDLTQADIAYKQANTQVERCEITAPFTGVVTARQASLGELASPGTPLLSLMDVENLELVADVKPDQISSLKNSKSSSFEWEGKRYPVKIQRMPALITPASRSRQVRMSFISQSALSGAAGRLHWSSQTAHVPADMLSERGGRIGLFVAEDNKARFIPVNNARAGHPIAVDLPEQTLIITDGRFGLSDGDPIEVPGL